MNKLIAVLSLLALLLAGCGAQKAAETEPSTDPGQTGEIAMPTGEGQAVVPEEGDISIELG